VMTVEVAVVMVVVMTAEVVVVMTTEAVGIKVDATPIIVVADKEITVIIITEEQVQIRDKMFLVSFENFDFYIETLKSET